MTGARLVALALACGAVAGAADLALPFDWRALRRLPAAFRSQGKDATRSDLHEVLERARSEADVVSEAYGLAGLAVLEGIEGNHQAARQTLESAVGRLAPRGWRLEAEASFLIASEIVREAPNGGDHEAIAWFELAARDFRAIPLHRMVARALQGLAMQRPPGPERRKSLDEALEAARAGGDEVRSAILQTLIGEALRQEGDLRGAIQTLENAANRLADLGEPLEASRAWSLLAVSYVAHGEPDEALRAIEQARSALANHPSSTSGGEIDLALAFAARGDCANAVRTADEFRSATPVESLLPRHRIRMALLAYAYLECGVYEEAAAVAARVIESFPDRAPSAAFWISSASHFRLGQFQPALEAADQSLARAGGSQIFDRVEALRWRALSLEGLGRTEEAADAIGEAVALDESVRDRLVETDEWLRAFGDRRESMGHDAVAILWKAGRVEAALSAAESFRARALVEMLGARSEIFNDPATAADLARFARSRGSTLLSYWVHPEALFAWAVDAQGGIRGLRIPASRTSIETLVRRARSLSYKPDRSAWRELYGLLIEPLASALPAERGAAVAVIANGPLLQLPFAALLAPNGRYLAEDYALYTAPAGALAIHDSRGGPRVGGPALLVGAPAEPPTDARGRALPPLPGAGRELRRVSALAGDSVELLTGEQARIGPVAAAAQDAARIHFATHAVVLEDRPLDSYLALSGRDKLTAERVSQMKLRADLVLLSACESGSGAVSSEGLLGFVRAFLFAGASSVIAPLWDIPDEPTAQLIEELYRTYGQGESKARALRAAQLKVLRQLRAGKVRVSTPAGDVTLPEHPALWAGFVLTGGAED